MNDAMVACFERLNPSESILHVASVVARLHATTAIGITFHRGVPGEDTYQAVHTTNSCASEKEGHQEGSRRRRIYEIGSKFPATKQATPRRTTFHVKNTSRLFRQR